MNNEMMYYEAQGADINLRDVMKVLTSAVTSIGVGVACNVITSAVVNSDVKSTNFNIPGGDVKVLYNLVDTRHEEDGDYYEMNFKIILHRKKSLFD